MTPFDAEWAAHVAAHGTPDRIEAILPDINCIPRGKWLPGTEAGKLAKGGLRLPESTYAPNIFGEEVDDSGLGSVKGDPDGVLLPIPGTLLPVPWSDGNVAQMLVEMVDDTGAPSALSARGHLARMVGRFAARGLHPVVATELEFYVCRPREETSDAPEPPSGLGRARNYDMGALDRTEDLMAEIIAAAQAQGLPTDTLTAEYGPGQFEINFLHTADVLAAADMAVLFRRLVAGVVGSHGLEATFMAKPYADHPGNGMHAHVSVLNDAGDNVFAADDGVGPLLGHAVAGVLATMRDLQLVFAPHLNSFRRFQPNSFAPTSPDWGIDHRGVAVRLPETTGKAARLEHRICGADVNPYLALTGILGGMLHGIEQGLVPPAPLGAGEVSDKPPLSHDWLDTIAAFRTSPIARDIWGEEFHSVLCAVKADEAAQLTRIIPPAEYRTYLGRI
ncbi:glutamine synthetase [Loktanella sp. IMCC34160]|uniref:glutamine synthetase family protein n=1 Tax=Loktanella sp. IMCC34160 TaxID=2510646 RepID=UPI00101C30FB|nr:glutamine synthetase family protein [Loktanella sp. IMCC34160]RYG90773.1 glutamine synthetase [Loktanella sp. IMCC34160]